MQNIVINDIEDNTGSVADFWFIPVQDVSSIPEAVEYTVADPIVLKTDKSWYTGKLTQETPGFEEKENKSQSGSRMRVSFGGFYPGHASDYTKAFNAMRYQRFLLVVRDFEGKKRLLGSLRNPLRFKFEFNTGSKSSSRKGYFLEWYHDTKDSPYFYESPFIAYPDEFGDDSDFIILDAYLAALAARVTILESEITEKLDKVDDKADDTTVQTGTNDNKWFSALSLKNWWTWVKTQTQSISAVWTFSASPTVPTPSNDADAANKGYVDGEIDSLSTYVDNEVTDLTTYIDDEVQEAKDYADTLVSGLWDDRGAYDPTATSTYPASGGSGTAGAILKGDIWTISVAGTIAGIAVNIGDTVRALVDTPGATDSNWTLQENNIGYVPENVSNKDTDDTFTANSDTKYPSQKAVKTLVELRADPVAPSSDGKEYYESITDGVKSWIAMTDANGTPIAEKDKLQAGEAGDWVNGSYAGATSGAVSGTKGGERFTGQDVTDSNYYRYECITDNNWIRTLLS